MAGPGTAIQLQGSNDGTNWSVLYSTTITGANAEVITSISSNLTAGAFQQHRIAVAGHGAGPIYVAQAQFSIGDTGANEICDAPNVEETQSDPSFASTAHKLNSFRFCRPAQGKGLRRRASAGPFQW